MYRQNPLGGPLGYRNPLTLLAPVSIHILTTAHYGREKERRLLYNIPTRTENTRERRDGNRRGETTIHEEKRGRNVNLLLGEGDGSVVWKVYSFDSTLSSTILLLRWRLLYSESVVPTSTVVYR